MNDYTKWHQSQPDIGLDEAIERIEGKMKAILIMDMPEHCARCRLHITVPDRVDSATHDICAGMVFPYDLEMADAVDSRCPLTPVRGYIDEHGNLISWEDDSDGKD